MSKIDRESSNLTTEQRKYLKEKFDLTELTFPMNGEYSNSTDNFMRDLYKMGIITESELKTYTTPVRYMRKPANYDSLPDDVKNKLKFVDDPLASDINGPTYTSYILNKDVSGLNVRDAFQYLAIQQKRQAEIAPTDDTRDTFISYSNMYSKLSEILDEVFV